VKPFWFGARLTLRRGASTRTSTIVSALAIAVGVTLLLVVAGVPNALERRAARNDARSPLAASGTPRLLVVDGNDMWHGQLIHRVSVARVSDGATPPPGVDALPAPGEVVLSPALAAAMDRPDGAGLATRYPGRRTSLVAPIGLLQPDELLAYVGVAATDLSRDPSGQLQRSAGFGYVAGRAKESGDPRENAAAASGVVALLLAALLAVLVAAATRLAANARSGRIAAMRLAGASIRQCRMTIAGEIAVASTAGTVLGVVAFAVLRSVGGQRWWPAPWFPEDLTIGFLSFLVVVGTPVLAHVVAQFGSRRALRDALASRRGRSATLAAGPRVITAGASVAALVAAAFEPGWLSKAQRGQLLIGGVLLLLVSLPLALPPVLAWMGTAWSRHARRLGGQLAASRVAYEPSAASRAVVAVAAALIIAAVIAGQFSESEILRSDRQSAANGETRFLAVTDADTTHAATLLEQLRQLPGVRAAVSSTTLSVTGTPVTAAGGDARADAFLVSAMACPDGAALLELDDQFCHGQRSVQVGWPTEQLRPRCAFQPCPAAGAQVTIVNPDGSPSGTARFPSDVVNPPVLAGSVLALTSAAAWIDPLELPPQSVGSPRALVRTDGTVEAEDRVRDLVGSSPLATVRSVAAETARDDAEDRVGREVAQRGVALALILALAAAAVAGADVLLDRRHLSGSLIALGMPRRSLWRTHVVFLLMPLITASLLGLLAGELLSGAMERINRRAFAWRLDIVVVTLATTVTAALVIAVMARILVHRSRVADAIRRE
jgi:hypothetical protein